MRTIFALLALIALAVPMQAMPFDRSNDSSVCKILIDTGSSATCYYTWQNTTTGQWEVVIGIVTYKGAMNSAPFYGNRNGVVLVDMT